MRQVKILVAVLQITAASPAGGTAGYRPATASDGPGSLLLRLYSARLLQYFSQLSALVHLHHRVAAADEFAVNVDCGGRAKALVRETSLRNGNSTVHAPWGMVGQLE